LSPPLCPLLRGCQLPLKPNTKFNTANSVLVSGTGLWNGQKSHLVAPYTQKNRISSQKSCFFTIILPWIGFSLFFYHLPENDLLQSPYFTCHFPLLFLSCPCQTEMQKVALRPFAVKFEAIIFCFY
jgi:hypothetical protein